MSFEPTIILFVSIVCSVGVVATVTEITVNKIKGKINRAKRKRAYNYAIKFKRF